MSQNYITIESVVGNVEGRIRQSLKFRTGRFVWRIKFTAPLNPATVNNKNLYVTNLNLTPLSTIIRYDSSNKTIEIEPIEAYAKNESYLLHITTRVKSAKGQNLAKEIAVQFQV